MHRVKYSHFKTSICADRRPYKVSYTASAIGNDLVEMDIVGKGISTFLRKQVLVKKGKLNFR